jgi:hypothetical protein
MHCATPWLPSWQRARQQASDAAQCVCTSAVVAGLHVLCMCCSGSERPLSMYERCLVVALCTLFLKSSLSRCSSHCHFGGAACTTWLRLHDCACACAVFYRCCIVSSLVPHVLQYRYQLYMYFAAAGSWTIEGIAWHVMNTSVLAWHVSETERMTFVSYGSAGPGAHCGRVAK